MEIPSYTSNIQSYGSQGGTKIASDYDNPQGISSASQKAVASEMDQLTSREVEQATEVIQSRQKLSEQEREKVVEQMNEFISSMQTGLSFRSDEQSGRNVVTIYEQSTGEIIRQIPDEEMLEVLRRLREQTARYSSGLLIDKV
ncbi:flagellar protein FlaG [Vibrio panuliri]|uniref:Flagellar biosynthesis protein FlaG n=1 Tax=Vibrio panuliri TaxID=1381081 RepID=A0A1Q9HM90_9VIBR|nr:flagellar protein FlaG [Vibrio panuliri]KAB1455020.1 flagellar protein FlaG [Vibrio panuliri]OLQ91741.1 flagellar biosynthesis protein FlaG [Vibrio panuliri]OLQ94744.1 flagellar biosynthesis protein FlaG [Vibrio panuliri]